MLGRPVGQFRPVDCFRLAGGEQHGFVCVDGIVERLGSGGVDEVRGVLFCVVCGVLDDSHQIVDALRSDLSTRRH